MQEDSGFSTTELKKFSEAGRTIAAAVGTSVELWARAEAGVILKTWAGRTKVRKDRALEISALLREYRQVRGIAYGLRKGQTPDGTGSINLGIKSTYGRVWYRVRSNGKPRWVLAYGNDFSSSPRLHSIPGADRSKLEQMTMIFRHQIKLAIEAAKGAAGLARQSIVQIADALGIRLEDVKGGGALSAAGLAKARQAIASNKIPYDNGTGITTRTAQDFYLTLINRYPKIGPLFMDATLQWVITGRLKYFRRNLEEGTFLGAKTAAKAYPYLEVLRLAS